MEDDFIDKIDRAEFLAGVDELAEQEGDWRDHLPYEALCAFNFDAGIRDQFGEHVRGCEFCQDLIALFGGSRPAFD